MRHLLLISIASLCFSSCAYNTSTASPEQKKLITAIEFAKANDDLQRVTIALFDLPPQGTHISKQRADQIVRYTVSAATTLKEVPNGWQPLIRTSWLQLKKELIKPESELETQWRVVDALVNAFAQ